MKTYIFDESPNAGRGSYKDYTERQLEKIQDRFGLVEVEDFGDGKTVVAVDIESLDGLNKVAQAPNHGLSGFRVGIALRVRPKVTDAPRSANDRPMPGYLASVETSSFQTGEEAVIWLTNFGYAPAKVMARLADIVSNAKKWVQAGKERVDGDLQKQLDNLAAKGSSVTPEELEQLAAELRYSRN